MNEIKAPNPGETKIVYNDGEKLIEKTYTKDDVQSIISNSSVKSPKVIRQTTKDGLLTMIDRVGKSADAVNTQKDDDAFSNDIKPIGEFCSYARTIPIDLNDDCLPEAGEPKKAVLFEGNVGCCSVGYPEENSLALLVDPVVIGTENRPLGLFVPFSASPEALWWSGELFTRAATNAYDNMNPNRKKLGF